MVRRLRISGFLTRVGGIAFEGVYRKHEAVRHVQALEQLRPTERDVFVHEHLYSCLSILDTKASVLLAYVGILFAAASLLLGLGDPGVASILIFLALVACGAAAACCLLVVWIHWTETPDLRHVREQDREEHRRHFSLRLMSVRNRRTLAYRLAWLLAQVGLALFGLGMFVGLLYP